MNIFKATDKELEERIELLLNRVKADQEEIDGLDYELAARERERADTEAREVIYDESDDYKNARFNRENPVQL